MSLSLSLKGRLAATIAIAALAILVLGGVLRYEQAQHRIAAEMAGSRTVAENALSRLIAELPASAHPQREIDGVVATFNGDRHVRLLFIDAFGAVRAQSHLAPPTITVPSAFEAILAPDRTNSIVPMPPNAAPVVVAMLVVVPINEIAEVWTGLLLDLMLLALFVTLAFGLVFGVVGRSLQPLGELVGAFHRIGKGDYGVALTPKGPPELAMLARGCNEMAERLAAMARQNRRLSEQLLRLQDEERAELARDLHDDVGPFLFAIDVDATNIAGLADELPAGEERTGIMARTAAIKQSARVARLEVRRILGTLRPGLLPGIGLQATLEHLVANCRTRHPEIAFRLDVSEEEFGPEIEALLHRVVREAVNNALRHGTPSAVQVFVRADATRVAFRIGDDGGGFGPGAGPGAGQGAGDHAGIGAPGGGFGLIGMRERVEAMGGRLTIAEIGLPAGILVAGEVPRRPDRQNGPADADGENVPGDDRPREDQSVEEPIGEKPTGEKRPGEERPGEERPGDRQQSMEAA